MSGADAPVSNPSDQWVEGPDGELIIPDKQAQFLEWLVDPDRTGSQKQMAEHLNVAPSRLRIWKRDPRFKAELEKRLGELNVDLYRIQQVVEAMYKAATQERDTKAASIYLQYVGRFMPTQRVITDRAIEELSDAELDAELAALATNKHLRVVGGEFDHE